MRRFSAHGKAGLATLLAASAIGLATPARAATSDVSAAGFVVTAQQEIKAGPHRVFEALGEVDKWWNPRHTYSGNAANLSLQTQGPGCLCERWDGNFVEHARVIYSSRDSALRLEGGLGPLQELAVNAVLTFTLKEAAGKTTLRMSYRISGNPAAGLQELAGPVDFVMSEQLQRLAAYIETGKPQ
jgi:uncharacterized protein YndB with AHSA1/START domain